MWWGIGTNFCIQWVRNEKIYDETRVRYFLMYHVLYTDISIIWRNHILYLYRTDQNNFVFVFKILQKSCIAYLTVTALSDFGTYVLTRVSSERFFTSFSEWKIFPKTRVWEHRYRNREFGNHVIAYPYNIKF